MSPMTDASMVSLCQLGIRIDTDAESDQRSQSTRSQSILILAATALRDSIARTARCMITASVLQSTRMLMDTSSQDMDNSHMEDTNSQDMDISHSHMEATNNQDMAAMDHSSTEATNSHTVDTNNQDMDLNNMEDTRNQHTDNSHMEDTRSQHMDTSHMEVTNSQHTGLSHMEAMVNLVVSHTVVASSHIMVTTEAWKNNKILQK